MDRKKRRLIGAEVVIRWNDSEEELMDFIAVGKEGGFPDDEVLYYCKDAEELLELMLPGGNGEFQVMRIMALQHG